MKDCTSQSKTRIFYAVQVFSYILAVAFPIFFFFFGIEKGNFEWFERSGSLTTVIPILISMMDIYHDRESVYFIKYNYARAAPPDVEEQARNYFPRKFFINSVLTVIGTIIWGYGDLIGRYIVSLILLLKNQE